MTKLIRIFIDDAVHTTPINGSPSVGIFFGVMIDNRAAILCDATVVQNAEEYGVCMTHPRDHFSMWESSRRHLGLTGEYDDAPRGRIVFELQSARFVVYLDRQLDSPTFRLPILHLFALPLSTTAFHHDQHYARARNRMSFP